MMIGGAGREPFDCDKYNAMFCDSVRHYEHRDRRVVHTLSSLVFSMSFNLSHSVLGDHW